MGNRPPQALDVEEADLGALLIEPNCIDEAMDELSSNCFYSEKHRMIFDSMRSLVSEHVALDILSVSQKLKEKGNLETVGGTVALVQLSQKIGAAAHIEYYIRILKQKCIQRELITASYDILKSSYDEATNVDDLIDMAQTKVFAAIQNNVKKDVQEIGKVINDALDDIQRLQKHFRTVRCPFRFCFSGQDHPRMAGLGPYHPCGPSVCRKDRICSQSGP